MEEKNMGEKIKRRKHFISTLGTGVYTQGIYACEKGRCNTAYEEFLKVIRENPIPEKICES